MKPVLVLQHLSTDGPGYLGTWLDAQGVRWEVRNTDAGEVYPERIDDYAALAILGGEMSANDPLPSLRQAERLFLQAVERGRPTLGHCLGGQLMARALGAAVSASPAPEIGWQLIQVNDDDLSLAWFGSAGSHHVYHWHYESFALPAGARLLASSAACPHQAFALGPHLAMQFHIEVDTGKVERWSRDGDDSLQPLLAQHRSVQGGEAMREAVAQHLPAHQRLADRIYRRWIALARAGS
jgi:GMP synthase (glutamine-hydrolysing)